MIISDTFKDDEVAVFGLGLSGVSAGKSLMAGGARVSAFDDREAGGAAAVKYGIPYGNLKNTSWDRFKALILAPGVPLTHPEPHWTVKRAQASGTEIIGDTELFFRAHQSSGSKAKIIAITGTNGKSTTTALIAHCLSHAGRKAQAGGNIGCPVLDLEPFEDDRFYVLELSSYQIDLTPSLKPTVAIHLNITPDHIDRHGSLAGYAAVKAKIFSKMETGSLAVVGVDDAESSQIADALTGDFPIQRLATSSTPENGIHFSNGLLEEIESGKLTKCIPLEGITTLRGTHNAQNAAAAYAACKFVGLSDEEIIQGFKSFPGLEHRMEVLGCAGKILIVNDSKATNADAASKALASFKDIFWIVGGLAKEGGIASLAPYHGNIRKAYLIGECAETFAHTLDGKVDTEISGTIESAVKAAAGDAAECDASEPVILLSPAAASFDQFPNFMVRGDAFRKSATDISGFKPLERQTEEA